MVKFHQNKKKYVTENHFDSTGDKIVESALINFKEPNIPSSKTTIIETLLILSETLQLAIDERR
jgi:hypothetical protein